MGLDTSHNAWHGGYGRFHVWRTWLAKQYGIPLDLMDGFYSEENSSNPFLLLRHKFPVGNELEMSGIRQLQKMLPLKWSAFRQNPIHILLNHSDCDGYINYSDCNKIAKVLRLFLSEITNTDTELSEDDYNYFIEKTKSFAEGCELAFFNKEKLIFQ